MEYTDGNVTIQGDTKKIDAHANPETSVAGASGLVTPPNSVDTAVAAVPPEQTALRPTLSKEQQLKKSTPETLETPETAAQQRRSAASHGTGARSSKKPGPGTPRPQNTKAAQGTSAASRGRHRQQSVSEPRTLDQIQAEHLYLVASLQQQEARIQTLVAVLAAVQSQLQTASTPAEARRLRKNAGFIKSKIADAEQQERLALLGVGHVGAELQGRYRHLQLQQHLHQQQLHIMSQAQVPAPLLRAHAQEERQIQPLTPYLVPHCSPFHLFQDSQTPGAAAAAAARGESWHDRRAGAEAGFMSPMSPLAPVFQPGAPLFFGRRTDSDGGMDSAAAAASAFDHDTIAEDAAAKQESLGGTTFAGEAEDKTEEKAEEQAEARPTETEQGIADAAPKSSTATVQCSLEGGSEAGVAGMHYILDSDVVGSGGGCGGELTSRETARPRSGSHGGKQEQRQPLTPAQKKRMSLPPVRFSWPEKRD